jgi:alanine racemase
MVRVGLLLYGLEAGSAATDLMPAMSVRGRINHLRQIENDEAVGYGWTWKAERPTRLATIPIGYADGVDRRLSNRMSALLMGRQIRQVGTISMDQMLFDITDVPEAQEGDVITLIGTDGAHSIQLADWAGMLDTITYELACRMRVRLPRIYTRHRSSRAQ